MTTYISPIGFNTTSVTRALLNHGIDNSDVVVLIRPEQGTDDDRGAEAIADVERLLQEIEPNISVRVEQIPHNDFETAVIQCSDIIQTADGSVIVSLSGGARDVLLPLTIATMAHERDIESTLGYSDLDGQVREWPLPNVTATVSDGPERHWLQSTPTGPTYLFQNSPSGLGVQRVPLPGTSTPSKARGW